jgi:hypothetical protein
VVATFADLYRQEIAAEEDVHRTLPFFGTALGIVIGALAYAAGRLPKFSDVATHRGLLAFSVSAVLLGLSITEAALVLIWLSRAIARRAYRRIGPEQALYSRLTALQAYYAQHGIAPEAPNGDLSRDMHVALLESYAAVTPANRELNQKRTKFRALASSHLVRSLIWALGATTVIFMADKLGYLPKVGP